MDQALAMGLQWYARQIPRRAGLRSGRVGLGWQGNGAVAGVKGVG